MTTPAGASGLQRALCRPARNSKTPRRASSRNAVPSQIPQLSIRTRGAGLAHVATHAEAEKRKDPTTSVAGVPLEQPEGSGLHGVSRGMKDAVARSMANHLPPGQAIREKSGLR